MQTERLSTLDEFGSRRFVIPAEVTGPFRTWRNRLNIFLLVIFLIIPWLKINGLQMLLFDIPNRHFEIFGRLFLAHDSPKIFLVLALVAVVLAFVTAIWGRVWCGWACPQTVFIDGLYRKIEIWVEGGYRERRKLHTQPVSWSYVRKSSLKWFLYLVVSSIISHSLIAYFTGSSHLIQMIQGSPRDHWSYFLIVSSVTALLLFNFGWFREQFCTIMCPYGRIQAVLMDNDSFTVLYDEARGEPRKGTMRDSLKRGDCVSCNRCVEVCPALIDIRKGIQMECIGCTACIDACNAIMKCINKPQNLIRYQSINASGLNLKRPRTLAYLTLGSLCALLLMFLFVTHAPFAVTLLRGKDTPYQSLPDGAILNHLKIHIFNQSQTAQEFFIQPSNELQTAGVKFTQAHSSTVINPGQTSEVHLFVSTPKKLFSVKGKAPLSILISETRTGKIENLEFIVVGPGFSGF